MKEYPPSYHRYRRENPTISCVLTRELRDQLDRYRRSLGEYVSYGQAVRMILQEKSDVLKEAIELTCPKCGETVVLGEHNDHWDEIKDYLSTVFFKRYRHSCQRRKFRTE